MAFEVERKWLVQALPDQVLAVAAQEIEQGYLTIGEGGSETRVRRREGHCTLTVKSGAGMVRGEFEIAITTEQFEALWPATEGRRIQKSRRAVPEEGGVTIEVDVYAGANAGLIVAEVEFDDPWGAEAFIPPYWFGLEVTDDESYKNHRLAR